MRRIHRFVVLVGACALVGLISSAGSVAQASNNEKQTPKVQQSLKERIRQHNLTADGCRE